MILLDTHIVVWLSGASHRLSNAARQAIEHARSLEEGLAISDMTLLELTNLARKGQIKIDRSLESALQEIESRFVVTPMSARVCARSLELPRGYPNDPADRIIGATALVHGVPLVTADTKIRKSKALPTIW